MVAPPTSPYTSDRASSSQMIGGCLVAELVLRGCHQRMDVGRVEHGRISGLGCPPYGQLTRGQTRTPQMRSLMRSNDADRQGSHRESPGRSPSKMKATLCLARVTAI